MVGGLRVTISPVPLGEFFDREVPALVRNANLENHPTIPARFGRKDETVVVLLSWFDDDAGQIRQSFRIFDPDLCVDHRVGPNGQWKGHGRGIAVSEEGPGGKHHPIGVERSGRRLEFHDGAPVGHRADECVDDNSPCRGAGRALGADVRPGVEVPGPWPLVDPVQAIWRRQMRELGS